MHLTLDEKKTINSSFGRAALGVSQARAPTWGHLTLGLPALALGQTHAPRGAAAALPKAHS